MAVCMCQAYLMLARGRLVLEGTTRSLFPAAAHHLHNRTCEKDKPSRNGDVIVGNGSKSVDALKEAALRPLQAVPWARSACRGGNDVGRIGDAPVRRLRRCCWRYGGRSEDAKGAIGLPRRQ